MSTTTALVVAVVVLALIGLALALASRRRVTRRQYLYDRFGVEYDSTVKSTGSRRRAEAELFLRERRRASLDIHRLPSGRAEHFRTAWTGAQAQFVDRPKEAVRDADRLVTGLMTERGYPTEDFDQRVADLSVDHADVLDHYREAHRIGAESDHVTTEELRQGMVHYGFLFDRLLADGEAD